VVQITPSSASYEDEDGNVAHIAEHGLTPEDGNAVMMAPDETGVSRSSGRPIAFGYTPDGRYICVVYEEIGPVHSVSRHRL
jgi:uncharacterized DUF497 family protein